MDEVGDEEAEYDHQLDNGKRQAYKNQKTNKTGLVIGSLAR